MPAEETSHERYLDHDLIDYDPDCAEGTTAFCCATDGATDGPWIEYCLLRENVLDGIMTHPADVWRLVKYVHSCPNMPSLIGNEPIRGFAACCKEQQMVGFFFLLLF